LCSAATAPTSSSCGLAGASYEEIARAGGGIVSTMQATRAASRAELVASALPRLDTLIAEGLTTIEIKSGYGLSLDDELKSLRAARALADVRQVSVTTTLLGAHALPPEYAEAIPTAISTSSAER
jgi:imidazolonepropionase